MNSSPEWNMYIWFMLIFPSHSQTSHPQTRTFSCRPSLQPRQLGVRKHRPRLPPPAGLAEVATEQRGEVEGGGGSEEEGVGGVWLGQEGVWGEGEVRQVGSQGGVGGLCQAPDEAPLLLDTLLQGPRQAALGKLSAWRHWNLTVLRPLRLEEKFLSNFFF